MLCARVLVWWRSSVAVLEFAFVCIFVVVFVFVHCLDSIENLVSWRGG